MAEPWLPFFISRDHGIADPGGSAEGEIEWIEVAGDPARLEEWLGGEELPVRVSSGEPGVLAAGVAGRVLR